MKVREMTDEMDITQYASSPCMAHELEACVSQLSDIETDAEEHDFHIVYLYVEEGGAGYRWQVRGHEIPDALAFSPELFPSASEACEAGRPVLERICSQFERYRRFY